MHRDKRALIDTLRKYKRHILGPLFTEAADTIEETLDELKIVKEKNSQLTKRLKNSVEFPCKYGDRLYVPTRDIVSVFVVKSLQIDMEDASNIWVNWRLESGICGQYRADFIHASEIGKTVFRTYEEAELALHPEAEETCDGDSCQIGGNNG
jgi:hypothetical protein